MTRLLRNDDKDAEFCHVCGASHYIKHTEVDNKVVVILRRCANERYLRQHSDTKQVYRVGPSCLQPVNQGPLLENPQSSSMPCFESVLIVQESHTSSPSSIDWKEQALSSEHHSNDSKGLVEFLGDSFEDIHSSDRNLSVTLQQKFYSGHLNVADFLSSKFTYARLDAGKDVKDVANSRNKLTITSGEVFEEKRIFLVVMLFL